MDKLQKIYSECKVTLSELAKTTGFSVSTVHRYVKGNVKEVNKYYYDSIYNALESYASDVRKTDVVLESSNTELKEINVENLKEQMMGNGISKPLAIPDVVSAPVVSTNTYQSKKPQRGDLYYIKNNFSSGQEQYGNRPGLILSNDKFNSSMGTVTVVYLTGQAKMPLPCHVSIKTSRESIVLCEQIFTVSKERLINYMGHVTETEMSMVNKGVMMGLGLTYQQVNMTDSHDYQRLQIENRMLKEFNETLSAIAMK